MIDGRYHHRNFSGLIVDIKDNCITRIVKEPVNIPMWDIVRSMWLQVIEDQRCFTEDEEIYFSLIN